MGLRVQTSYILTVFCCVEIIAFIHLPPVNFAVDIGSDTVTLNCASNVSILGWSFQAPGSASSVIVVAFPCLIISPTSCSYAVNTSGASDCQLIITSASPACAGTYICQDTDGTRTTRSAMVIVLDSKPQCSVNATNNTQVEESTHVMMECSVTYTTPFLQPQLNWSQPSEAVTVHDNISYAYSSIISTNVIPRISSGKCRLSFTQPTNVPPTNPTSGTATNAPTYNSSCTVADIYPMYCPIHPNIAGAVNGDIVTNGTILICSADANPHASQFEWRLIVNGTESWLDSTIATVRVLVPGMYVCNVANGLPGCTNTMASLFILDVIPGNTQPMTSTLPTLQTDNTTSAAVIEAVTVGDSSNDGLIAVCVCLGISVTINIITTVIIIVILRRQKTTIATNRTQADDHIGHSDVQYTDNTAPYENVSKQLSSQMTAYEHLNPSIDISPYQELSDRRTN